MTIYGEGRTLQVNQNIWEVVALWLGTPAQFGNPVFDLAAGCYQ